MWCMLSVGLQERMEALTSEAKTMGEPFTFHDLKAKGISDHKDNFGGHRSASMRKVYVRKLQEVADLNHGNNPVTRVN